MITLLLTLVVGLFLVLVIQRWILKDIRKLRVQHAELIKTLNFQLNHKREENNGPAAVSHGQTDAFYLGAEIDSTALRIKSGERERRAKAGADRGDSRRKDSLLRELEPVDQAEIEASLDKPADTVEDVDRASTMGDETIQNEILAYLRRIKKPAEYKEILRHVTSSLNEADSGSSVSEIVFNAINFLEDQGYIKSGMVGGRLICKLIEK